MYMLSFSPLRQLGEAVGVTPGKNLLKIAKNGEKTRFWGLKRGGRGLKSRDPQKAHLDHPLYVHAEFQPPTSIRRGCGRDTSFFQGQKRSKTRFSPLLIALGSWNFSMLYNFQLPIDWFWVWHFWSFWLPLAPHQSFKVIRILIQGQIKKNLSGALSNDTQIPNLK